MKIGVVSDTHSKTLPPAMLKDFEAVDLIIHVGDLCDMTVFEILSRIKETRVVKGNMDDGEVARRFPSKEILEREGWRIGFMHGEGAAAHALEKVRDAFKNDDLDVVIFGHSHQPFNEVIGKTLYFNPGSPTDKIFAPYCSYGIIDCVKGGQIKGTIKKV